MAWEKKRDGGRGIKKKKVPFSSQLIFELLYLFIYFFGNISARRSKSKARPNGGAKRSEIEESKTGGFCLLFMEREGLLSGSLQAQKD